MVRVRIAPVHDDGATATVLEEKDDASPFHSRMRIRRIRKTLI
jgi:hypothetical protein